MGKINDTLSLFKNTIDLVGRNKDILKPTWSQVKIAALFYFLLLVSIALIFISDLSFIGQIGIISMIIVLNLIFPFIEVKYKAAQSWIVYQTFTGKKTNFEDGLKRAKENRGDIFVLGLLDILMTYFAKQLRNKSNSGVGMFFKIILSGLSKVIEEGWDLIGNFLLPASIVTEKKIGEAAKDIKELKNNVPGALAGVFGIDFVGNTLKSMVSGIFVFGIIIGVVLLFFTGTWIPLVLLILVLIAFNVAANIIVEMVKVVYFTLFYVSIAMPMQIPQSMRKEVLSYLKYEKPENKSDSKEHHEKLKLFITKYRKQGYSNDKIKKFLVDNGWPESEVDKALKK